MFATAVAALSNSDGDIVERYEYDVFGEPAIYDANDQTLTASAYDNPYMFTGRRYDAETGLYYYRFRYYKADIDRFRWSRLIIVCTAVADLV